MISKQAHTRQLENFEVDRLLKLLKIEAEKRHDGKYTILCGILDENGSSDGDDVSSFTVFFGHRFRKFSYEELYKWGNLKNFSTLKEAVIFAIVNDYRLDPGQVCHQVETFSSSKIVLIPIHCPYPEETGETPYCINMGKKCERYEWNGVNTDINAPVVHCKQEV